MTFTQRALWGSNGAMWQRLIQWARHLKSEIVALWFCYRDPRTPLAAKVLAVMVVAYAFSPIDLIPDFIPVLGYLDDLLLLPLGVWLVLKLVPRPVLDECRALAAQWVVEKHAKPVNWFATAVIVVVWLALAWLLWRWFSRQ